MNKHPDVTIGSGNVFADLGLPDADALLVKAQLTYQIAKRIKTVALTQSEAGQRLGLSQPDVSRLMKGRATGFSMDRLLALLNALDFDVDIVLRKSELKPHSTRVRIAEETSTS